jgi:3-oxoadipate enol-lactonase
MPTVSVKGRQIGYEEVGAGEPLILIHGAQSDRHQFNIFLPLLGDGIRAIAYDQRDTRENPYDGGSAYSIVDMAGDLADFLDAMGIAKAHVLGTSYGGMIAMAFAIHYPERVHSLVLAATTPSHTMTEPITQFGSEQRDPAAIERFMLENAITSEAIDSDPQLVADVKTAIRPGSPDAVARRLAAPRLADCRDDLHCIMAPTLVLHGQRDRIFSSRTAIWTAEHIKGSKLVLLPDAAHSLTLENRHPVSRMVREFVLDHPIKAAGNSAA